MDERVCPIFQTISFHSRNHTPMYKLRYKVRRKKIPFDGTICIKYTFPSTIHQTILRQENSLFGLKSLIVIDGYGLFLLRQLSMVIQPQLIDWPVLNYFKPMPIPSQVEMNEHYLSIHFLKNSFSLCYAPMDIGKYHEFLKRKFQCCFHPPKRHTLSQST